MKEIKFIRDYGKAIFAKTGEPIHKKGEVKVMSNDLARHFTKKIIDWNYFERTGKIKKVPLYAIELKDLGIHIGCSKHIYIKNGKSGVFM